VLAALGDGGIGRAVYRFTSSFVHAQGHAFTMFQPPKTSTDPQTPMRSPSALPPRPHDVLMVAAMAVHTSAARCGRYFEWDLRAWLETISPSSPGGPPISLRRPRGRTPQLPSRPVPDRCLGHTDLVCDLLVSPASFNEGRDDLAALCCHTLRREGSKTSEKRPIGRHGAALQPASPRCSRGRLANPWEASSLERRRCSVACFAGCAGAVPVARARRRLSSMSAIVHASCTIRKVVGRQRTQLSLVLQTAYSFSVRYGRASSM